MGATGYRNGPFPWNLCAEEIHPREPMDERSKARQLERYQQSVKHQVDHEEQKARKSRSRVSKAGRKASRRERHHDLDADPDAADQLAHFEPIRKIKKPVVSAAVDLTTLETATVVAVHQSQVELASGETARVSHHLLLDESKRLAVGDVVGVSRNEDTVRIDGLHPRRSVLARPDPGATARRLILAANVDYAVVVAAAVDPPFRPGLVDRFLVALQFSDIDAVLCVNKIDLCDPEQVAALEQQLQPFRELGLPVFTCSAEREIGLAAIQDQLAGSTCVFVGHSGVGKSSLLNAMDPSVEQRTGSVREFDGRGRHTTTGSSMFFLPRDTRIIDTPGIRGFSVEDLPAEMIRAAFPEFIAAGRCRFNDCTHVEEPDCAVQAAVENGVAWEPRYHSYLRMLDREN